MPQCVTGRLTIHSCNINEMGVFDDVCDGAHGLIHSADQLMSAGGEERGHRASAHPDAALHAINGIIASVQKSPTMCRLVYTSSIAAVLHESDTSQFLKRPLIHDWRYPGANFTSQEYKDNVNANGYAIAKIMVEQRITEAGAAAHGVWDAVIINPGDNYGPLLAPHQLSGGGGGFPSNIKRLLEGKKIAMLEAYHPMWTVDVRDCATGHINVLESHVVANGDRHLMISTDKVLMEDLTACMGEVFKNSLLNPTTTADVDPHPDMDEDQKEWFRHVWDSVELRNEAATRVGTTFRPLADTVRDTAESLIAVCGVQPRMRSTL